MEEQNLNPFKVSRYKSGNIPFGMFASFIRNQIVNLCADDSIKIDVSGRSRDALNTTVRYIGRSTSKKFSIKKDVNGDLWVKRLY